MVKTRSARGGNSPQPLGRGQVPSNLPPHPPPPIPNAFPHVDHTEGGDENQPHNSARNSTSTTNQDVVATQLAAMQQQFGVFQLVLAQLLARNNPGDPLINLLNPAPPQPPTPPQNPKPVQHAPAVSESQGQSHIAPAQQPPHDDVTRRLDSLEKLVIEQRGVPPPHPATDSVPHPLNTNIILEPYPVGFRIPQLETYDGTKDPDDHLHAFYSCMQAQNASDALPSRSINSYTELASAFATKFSSRRLIRKTTSELMQVKQRDGESLKNFMSRFNDVVLEVNSFDQAVGITTVISGLSHERFRDSLLKHPANTFSEVNDRSLKFITAEEYALSQNITPIKNQHPDWRDENLNRKQMKTTQNRGPMSASTSRFGRPNSTPPQQPAVVTPHNDPLVTSVTINNCEMQRVLVDTGSALDIMYFHCFESLGLDPALLQWYDGPIYGFNNQPVPVEGVLTMNVAFGSGQSYVTPSVRFLVVKMASSINVVIGRLTLTEIRAVVSQSHLCMKFPTPTGIATLRGNQEVTRHCYITSVTQPQKGKAQTPEINPKRIPDDRQVMGVEIVDNRPEDETRAAPVEDVEEVQIDNRDPSRKTTNSLRKPVAQKRCLFGRERLQVIKEEVEKLLQASFVRRVDYCEWVANLVLVKKANGKWRMCIDYTNLNDACPKDCYPMPNIDKLVEAASGNERLSFLDAYSGYHQNAGATYQKMVTIVFRAQIGRNLEVYVDDIVRGIEVNPEKIKAIAEMEPLKSVKDIQRLIGRVAALHRFILKSADKCLLFFKIMRSAAQKDESDEAISSVLVREEAKQQKPIYYISSVLHGAELRYPIAEKVALAVVTSARKLRPYFQSHPIIILTDQPLRSKGSGAGALLIGQDGYRSEHALKFNFDATNNMAEYEALLLGLQLALELKLSAIQVYSDSQLVVNQINSICEVVDPVMVKYVALVTELKCRFQKFCLSKIPRTKNELADSLSKFASDSSSRSRSVFVEVLDEPSFMKPRVMEISTDPGTPSWTDPILSFLRDGIVPEDRQEAMKLRRKASREVHEGVCGSHMGARTLAHKVLRQGYYRPNMYKDAIHFVQRCLKCHFFAHLTHQPAEELTTLVAPWPFAQWGLDLLGPFVKGVGGVTHLILGVDYFTKWVEARPLSSLTSKKVEDFVFSSIICRYGISNQIVTDNGTQEEARLRTLVYKQKIANFYNKRVRPRTFKVGDLVLKKAGLTGFETRFGKLAPNWEGPYTIAEVPHLGAYVLRDTEGKQVPRVWNVNNLKKFYP
ncbi:hypothetical protein SLEP1_g29914 [Rubroshorea leprosula]|uniref:RNA-directed DNA polymerase n=1 Tax=Rubroshorea leprosula TaxID=152421 RepID=A0AAV5JYF8_9ROSI|nr:hypothetical protein SLEP1_g29914 [Rubroshorea leprosula]